MGDGLCVPSFTIAVPGNMSEHPHPLGRPTYGLAENAQQYATVRCGQGGYITPAASGSPSASEWGAESEVAHLWARWLHCAF